jgi:hypothetical protein
MRETGHPHGWRGHVADHVVPLSRGGADDSSNLQWQTVKEAKCKDRFELWVPPAVLIQHYGKGALAK